MTQESGRYVQDVYTIPEVAELLGRTTRTIQNWIRTGKLECVEVTSRSRYIRADQLANMLGEPLGTTPPRTRPTTR